MLDYLGKRFYIEHGDDMDESVVADFIKGAFPKKMIAKKKSDPGKSIAEWSEALEKVRPMPALAPCGPYVTTVVLFFRVKRHTRCTIWKFSAPP